MTEVPTIKIRSDRRKGYRIINLSDFDPDLHEAFDEVAADPLGRRRSPEAEPRRRGSPRKDQ